MQNGSRKIDEAVTRAENEVARMREAIAALGDRVGALAGCARAATRVVDEIERGTASRLGTAEGNARDAITALETVKAGLERAMASFDEPAPPAAATPALPDAGGELARTKELLLNVLKKKVELEVQCRLLSDKAERLEKESAANAGAARAREAEEARIETYRGWLGKTREKNLRLRAESEKLRDDLTTKLDELARQGSTLQDLRDKLAAVQDERTSATQRLRLLEKKLSQDAGSAKGAVEGFKAAESDMWQRLTLHFDYLFDLRQGLPFLDFGYLRGVVRKLIFGLRTDPGSVLDLSYYTNHTYLRHHTLNVAKLSLYLGIQKGYDDATLEVLGASALLHDLGMIHVPKSIIYKPSRLSAGEWKELRRHPASGEELFRQIETDGDLASKIVAKVVTEHHERADGSGYPDGKTNADLHEFSKILSIVDSFEAMTAPRAHRPPRDPHEAMKALIREAGAGKFDEALVKTFLRAMSLYPVGSFVRLSTGEIARVVAASAGGVDRPIVRIVADANGRQIPTPSYIDLSKDEAIKIQAPHVF